jgi:hypothetical protein
MPEGSFKLIPHKFTDLQKDAKAEISQTLLDKLNGMSYQAFCRVLTGDET